LSFFEGRQQTLGKEKVMKKLVCLSMLVLLLTGTSSVASEGKFSIGGFAGLNIPLVQDDAKSGALFGAKGRIVLLPFLGLEPNLTFAKYGGKDMEIRGKSYPRDGGDFTSFGVDLLLGSMSGFGNTRIYGLAGINSNTYKREGLENESGLGLAFGTGFEFFPTEIVSLEVRAKYHSIKLGDGGRAHLEISGGLNYYFGSQ
jgi:hypothetical protein